MDRVLHGADLDALQVLGLLDGTDTVGDVAHAVLHPAQAFDADVLQGSQDLLAHIAVAHGLALGTVLEQEGQVKDQQLIGKASQGRRDHDTRLDGVHLHALNTVTVAGQLGVGKHVDMHATAALFLHQFSELVHALDGGVIVSIGAGGNPGHLGSAGGGVIRGAAIIRSGVIPAAAASQHSQAHRQS